MTPFRTHYALCYKRNASPCAIGRYYWALYAAWCQHSSALSICSLHFKHRCKALQNFRITSILRHSLAQWADLASTLNATPAPIRNIIPTAPTALGASDASGEGIGGFWFPTQLLPDTAAPLVWRHQFDSTIADQLTTTTNPMGQLSINDLELTALIQAYTLASHHYPSQTRGTLLCTTDNATAHAWVKKGSTTTHKAPAFLLQLLATLTRGTACTLDSTFTAGVTNTLADFCSRSFHLDDTTFLATVNQCWPLQTSWQLAHPTKSMQSQWTSALFKRTAKPELAWVAPLPMIPRGKYGQNSVLRLTKMSSCPTMRIPYPSCNSLLGDTESAPFLPQALQSTAERWKAPYAPLGRRLLHWAAQIPGCYPVENWTSGYTGN
jgi:hypothetical protein